MATFTWTYDAPTGTYKSHAMSRKLWEAALPGSVFMDHVRPIDSYGRKNGESVTLVRVANITEPTTAQLQEAIRIPEDDFALSTQTITVKELGRAVPYTSLALDLSEFDLENPIQKKLREQMRLVLDSMAAAAFKRTQVKYAITGATSNNIAFNGTFGATSTANLAVWHIEEIRDLMYDTLNVPPYEGGDYMAI